MDARARIPVLALLGVQFTTACEDADPIVGTWSATMIGDEVLPFMYTDGEYMALGELELRIGEDLHGQMWSLQRQSGPGFASYYEYGMDLVVIPEEGAKYRIQISQGGLDFGGGPEPGYADGGYYEDPGPEPEPEDLVLDCELADDKLRCTGFGSAPPGEPPSTEEIRWQRKA